jgi:hypothetical protein
MSDNVHSAEAIVPEPPFSVRALYDYKDIAAEGLAISQGDVIEVIKVWGLGWWEGKCGESCGIFPSTYCEVIASESDSNHDESHDESHGSNDGEENDLS